MKKFLEEFKTFISRGNVLDMAVGVIIGNAFGKIVTSLVNDIFMPLVGVIIGGHDFSKLHFGLGSAEINYGMFIQNIVDFLIVAFCIFVVIKFINNLEKKLEKRKKQEEKEEAAPVKSDEVILLEEIRDLLKKDKKKSSK